MLKEYRVTTNKVKYAAYYTSASRTIYTFKGGSRKLIDGEEVRGNLYRVVKEGVKLELMQIKGGAYLGFRNNHVLKDGGEVIRFHSLNDTSYAVEHKK